MAKIAEWSNQITQMTQLKNENKLTIEGIEAIEIFKKLCIENNIDFEKSMQNFVLLDEFSIFDLRPPDLGTKSKTTILAEKSINAIPTQYNRFFISSFPDVYNWVNSNIETDLDLINLNNDMQTNQALYINSNLHFTILAYSELCTLFKKKAWHIRN